MAPQNLRIHLLLDQTGHCLSSLLALYSCFVFTVTAGVQSVSRRLSSDRTEKLRVFFALTFRRLMSTIADVPHR